MFKMFNTTSFWRKLTNFWTIVFFAAIIFDYISENALDEEHAILAIAGIYGAILAIYSAEKEFKRWHDEHESGMHPGEIYSVLWTVLIIGIIITNRFLHLHYHMPPEVSASFIVVLGVLAITKQSKKEYRKQHPTRSRNNT